MLVQAHHTYYTNLTWEDYQWLGLSPCKEKDALYLNHEWFALIHSNLQLHLDLDKVNTYGIEPAPNPTCRIINLVHRRVSTTQQDTYSDSAVCFYQCRIIRFKAINSSHVRTICAYLFWAFFRIVLGFWESESRVTSQQMLLKKNPTYIDC